MDEERIAEPERRGVLHWNGDLLEAVEELRRLQQLEDMHCRTAANALSHAEALKARVTALEEALRTALTIAEREAETAHLGSTGRAELARLWEVLEKRGDQ